MKTIILIIGQSMSGKSFLSNMLKTDFSNIIFNDIDKQSAFKEDPVKWIHENCNEVMNSNAENSVTIFNTISDIVVETVPELKTINLVKVYITPSELSTKRTLEMAKQIKDGKIHLDLKDFILEYNLRYNKDEDFLYNRENYFELIEWLKNKKIIH